MFEDFNQNMEKLSKKDFEDTLSFKRACNLVQEEALHDSRLSQDVLLTYDHLLKSDLKPIFMKNSVNKYVKY